MAGRTGYRVEWSKDEYKRIRMTGYCDASAPLETLMSQPGHLFGVESKPYELISDEASDPDLRPTESSFPKNSGPEQTLEKCSHAFRWAALAGVVALLTIASVGVALIQARKPILR